MMADSITHEDLLELNGDRSSSLEGCGPQETPPVVLFTSAR